MKVLANYVQSCWFMFSVSAWKQHMWALIYMSLSLQAWHHLPVDIILTCVWLCARAHIWRACQRWSVRVRLDFMCLTNGPTCGRTSRGADWLLLAVCMEFVQLTLRATAFSPGAASHWCFIGFDHERVRLMRSRMQGEEVWRLGRVGRGGAGWGGKYLQSKKEKEERAPGSGHVYRRASASSAYTHKHSNYAVIFFLCVLSLPPLPPPTEITVFLCFAYCSSNRYHLCLVLTGLEGQTDACCKENRPFLCCCWSLHAWPGNGDVDLKGFKISCEVFL